MEDSTECFVHMLDALRSADARNCSCLAYTARETRTCGCCGHVVNAVRGTDVTAPVWQLGLPVDGSQSSFQKLVYLDKETVNEYQCDYCLVRADGATKQLSLLTTPETLVVTLNRFGGDVIDAKLHNAVVPDDTLDVRRLGGADKYWLCGWSSAAGPMRPPGARTRGVSFTSWPRRQVPSL